MGVPPVLTEGGETRFIIASTVDLIPRVSDARLVIGALPWCQHLRRPDSSRRLAMSRPAPGEVGPARSGIAE